MKNTIYTFFAAALLCLTAISCNKENIIDQEILDEPFEPEVTHLSNTLLTRSASGNSGSGLLLDCVLIPFPFVIIDDQSNAYTVTDEQSFVEIFIDNQTVINFIDFVYPLNLVKEDGTALAVADAMALGEIFTECIPDGGWTHDFFPAYLIDLENSCLSLQFPVTLEDEFANQEVATNQEEFVAFLAEKPYQFAFPVDLADESGNVFTANNVDDLFTLLMSCNEIEYDTTVYDWQTEFEHLACYVIEFPLDVNLTDGTVVTVNSHTELFDLMLMGNVTGYAFPLTLITETDSTIVVSNQQELSDAIEKCPNVGGGNPTIGTIVLLITGDQELGSGLNCYDISYPITLENINDPDDILVANSGQELISNSNIQNYNIQYPTEVTMVSTGQSVVLNSDTDLENLLVNCN